MPKLQLLLIAIAGIATATILFRPASANGGGLGILPMGTPSVYPTENNADGIGVNSVYPENHRPDIFGETGTTLAEDLLAFGNSIASVFGGDGVQVSEPAGTDRPAGKVNYPNTPPPGTYTRQPGRGQQAGGGGGDDTITNNRGGTYDRGGNTGTGTNTGGGNTRGGSGGARPNPGNNPCYGKPNCTSGNR